MSERIGRNKVVAITYSITDEAGTVLEQCDLPVTYLHGGRTDLLPKVAQALEGHQPGDRVEIRLSPAEGFGEHDPALTYTDDIDNVPPQFRRLGAEVEMQNDRGETRTFRVSRIENGRLTVDGNHPLAGKVLVFHVKVESVREATAEELRAGADSAPPLH